MSRDWSAVVAGMTLDEKASLTNGVDFWNLAAIERQIHAFENLAPTRGGHASMKISNFK